MENITNALVTDYIHSFYKPVSQEMGELRKIGESDNVPIIQKEAEMFLATLLQLKKPTKILEIGTAIGYSSLFFASKCPNAQVFTIEKDEYAFQAAKQNIASQNLSKRVHPLFGDGQEQIEKLKEKGHKEFDLVFIDAAKSHYRRFLEAALGVCQNGALIVSDNIFQRGMTVSEQYDPHGKHKTNIKKMRDYIDYICNAAELETCLLSVGDGIAVSIYRGENG